MSYSRLEDDEASLVLADLSMDDDSFGEVPVRSHHTHSRSTSNSTSEAWSRSRPVSGSSAHTGLSTDSLGTTINSFPVPPVPAAHHGAGRAPKPPRFSIFAAPPAAASSRGIGLGHPSASAAEEERSEVHEDEDHEDTHHEEQKEEGHEQNDEQEPGEEVESPAIREERLRASLAELKKFSAVFEGFHHALKDARAHNERVAARVRETHALLDQYVAFQGQSLHIRDLILNTKWTGGLDDDAAITAAEQAKEAAALRAAEEARIHAEREEAERAAAEELAREAANATRGRGRGRGLARGRIPSGTGIARPTSTGIPTRTSRPGSAASRAGSSVGGRWSHVQGSGYGPK